VGGVVFNLFFLLVFLVCLALIALMLRRIEMDMRKRAHESRKLDEERDRLSVENEALVGLIQQERDAIARTEQEHRELRSRRDEAEVALKLAQDAPKDRLLVFDRATLVHGRLWEVKVVNDTLIRTAQPVPTAAEWAGGRICLVGATSERDARQRTESRFPPGQGYRILGVERFIRL